MTALSIVECGRTAAAAVLGQRDLQDRLAAYPEIFPSELVDPALCGAVALANAFSGRGLDAARLRPANRMALWAFAVDHLVDREIAGSAEVAAVMVRCAAVAAGAEPTDPLTAFLAEIRDELADFPTYRSAGAVWRQQVAATLGAMLREWQWRAGGRAPTFEEYLNNADNLGFCLVFAAHRVANGVGSGADPAVALAAARAVQRALRLVNDMATVDRDAASGDLNALHLGANRADVTARLAELAVEAGEPIAALRAEDPGLAGYLAGQLDFNRGFHPVSDYRRPAPSSPVPETAA